jgi:hypothetical protein
MELDNKVLDEIKKLLEKQEQKKQPVEKGGLTPISDWCKHYAVIFDETGRQIGKVAVKYKDLTFSFGEHSFNFKPNDSSFLKIKGFWNSKKYYFYNIDNPDALILKSSGIEAFIDSKTYKALLENKLVQQLNDLVDGTFMAFIKKYWWIFILIGIFVWFFASGQQLPFGADKTPEIISSTITTR